MGSRRRAVLRTLLATLVVAPFLAVAPRAQAADDDPDLAVRITDLTPSRLTGDDTITMSGTVTNRDDHPWTKAQAYMVIPRYPFTTRAQVDAAISGNPGYTGSRIVELKAIDEIGDLAPGSTTPFEVSVPDSLLGLSGAEGVYPVGVQILGTDVDGTRDNTAIGRATTFLPKVSDQPSASDSDHPAVSAGLVWPFLMPDHRGPKGTYVDPSKLVSMVSSGGLMRNRLDLVARTAAQASTIILDPALLVGLDDVAKGRHLPDGVTVSASQREAVQTFLEDLVAVSRSDTLWVLGYDRPDVLALADAPSSARLGRAVDRATDATLATFQLTGRRVAWPTRSGVTGSLLSSLRGSGESPVLVDSADVPDWERRDGSLVQYPAASGPVPLLVDDNLDAGVPGQTSVVTVRQRMLSEAALASLQRGADPGSHADAVTIVDPRWDPGPSAGPDAFGPVFDAPFVSGVSLDDLITTRLSRYEGSVPTSAEARPIGAAQVADAAAATETSTLLSDVIPEGQEVDADLARDVAGVLGVRWREMRTEGLSTARARLRHANRELAQITIEGPDAVTLSSSEGRFPLTVSNNTDHPVRVAVAIDSSNPSLQIPDLDPVEVGAGERNTLTVNVDMGQQGSATLSARMTTAENRPFGTPAVFNVRSSRVGAALWVAIGLAAAFVGVALARRFLGRRGRTVHETASDLRALRDDGDD